jgi:hypothetical protein
MRAKRSMTAIEFDALRPLLRISEDRISAARLALVDGQTLAGVAKLYRHEDGNEWTRQAVGDAVRVVWETFGKFKESERVTAQAHTLRARKSARAGTALPAGWVEVTLFAPKSLVVKFRREIAAAQAAVDEPLSQRKAHR